MIKVMTSLFVLSALVHGDGTGSLIGGEEKPSILGGWIEKLPDTPGDTDVYFIFSENKTLQAGPEQVVKYERIGANKLRILAANNKSTIYEIKELTKNTLTLSMENQSIKLERMDDDLFDLISLPPEMRAKPWQVPLDAPSKRDLEKLQGRWMTSEGMMGGKSLAALDLKFQLSFKKDLLTIESKRGSERLKIKLSSANNPRKFELYPADRHKGGFKAYRMMRGIFKFEKGKVILCWAKKGSRPKEFAGAARSDDVFWVLERLASESAGDTIK